jgi:hypothetical protein
MVHCGASTGRSDTRRNGSKRNEQFGISIDHQGASFMKSFCTLAALCMALMAAPLTAQELEAKLSGNTASQRYVVKDKNGNALFLLGGNGQAAFGSTLKPDVQVSLETALLMCGLYVRTTKADGIGLSVSALGNRAIEATLANEGAAVAGISQSAAGQGVGLYGASSSPAGIGVWGTNSTGGKAIWGTASHAGIAIHGQNADAAGWAGRFDGNMHVSGNVGIGTLTPDALLHVAGQVKITGGSPGTGKVLTSDADGLAVWQTPASTGLTLPFDGTVSNTTAAFKVTNTGTSNTAGAIAGHSAGSDAVEGVTSAQMSGVLGRCTNGSGGYGVFGAHASGNYGILGAMNSGVIGQANGSNWAGWFSGPVKTTGKLDCEAEIIATGSFGSGSTLTVAGTGTRLIWYPKKAAFRTGGATGSSWDDANIGDYSVAMGANTKASATASIALGSATVASGNYSTALGNNTTASGDESFAGGSHTTASAWKSIALGGDSWGSATGSVAIGDHVTASGTYSTALGTHASTNGKTGAFVIGDNSTNTDLTTGSNNCFKARFAGGYDLYSNSGMTLGVTLAANGTSWATLSDSSKKTNHHSVNGEDMLASFSTLRLGSWNYKADNDPMHRHYGPMAQEWFSAFGHDGVGTVGNDTTLSSSDVDGVLAIAIKALEARTAALRGKTQELASLKQELTQLKHQVSSLQESNAVLTAQTSAMQELRSELVKIKALLSKQSGTQNHIHAAAHSVNE